MAGLLAGEGRTDRAQFIPPGIPTAPCRTLVDDMTLKRAHGHKAARKSQPFSGRPYFPGSGRQNIDLFMFFI